MATIPIGQNEVFREIEVDLGRSMSLEELRYVEQECLDCEIQIGILTTQAVANKINGVFKSNQRKEIRKTVDNVPTATARASRSRVNSSLVAYEAGTMKDVEDFRRDVLKSKLLDVGQIVAWIKYTQKKDGKPTRWLDGIELPADAKVGMIDGKLQVDSFLVTEAIKIKGFSLKYWEPEENMSASVYVTLEGILDRLRILSIKLADWNKCWTQEQAATFILTGQTPWVEFIEITAIVHPNNQHVMANKLLLSIDPRSSVDDVTSAFKWGRRQFFGDTGKSRTSEKNQMLTLFYAKNWVYSANKRSRRELVVEWNKICDEISGWNNHRTISDWKYDPNTGLGNFQRDAKSAYESYLTGRSFKGDA